MAGVSTDARSGVQLWPEGGHDRPRAGGRRDWVPHHGRERWQGSALTQGQGSTLARYGGPCAAGGRVNRGTPQEGEGAGAPQTQGLGIQHAHGRAGAHTDV